VHDGLFPPCLGAPRLVHGSKIGFFPDANSPLHLGRTYFDLAWGWRSLLPPLASGPSSYVPSPFSLSSSQVLTGILSPKGRRRIVGVHGSAALWTISFSPPTCRSDFFGSQALGPPPDVFLNPVAGPFFLRSVMAFPVGELELLLEENLLFLRVVELLLVHPSVSDPPSCRHFPHTHKMGHKIVAPFNFGLFSGVAAVLSDRSNYLPPILFHAPLFWALPLCSLTPLRRLPIRKRLL